MSEDINQPKPACYGFDKPNQEDLFAMDKDTPWIVSALIAVAALVAAAVYFSERGNKPFQDNSRTDSTEIAVPAPSSPIAISPQAQTSARPERTGTIRMCIAPDGTKIYTDLAECEEVDLSNRISVVEAPDYKKRTPSAERSSSTKPTSRSSTNADRTASRCDSLSLRSSDQVESDIPRACRWSWGRARDLERLLSNADMPRESIWAGEYCERLREVGEEGCRIDPAAFCYEQICPF